MPDTPSELEISTETNAAEEPAILEPEPLDEGPLDIQLDKLDERLHTAVGDLMDQNKQVENYLQFLADERNRALKGTEADQLTLADAMPDETDTAETAPEAPTSSETAP